MTEITLKRVGKQVAPEWRDLQPDDCKAMVMHAAHLNCIGATRFKMQAQELDRHDREEIPPTLWTGDTE